MCQDIDNFDEKVDLVIGNILSNADETTKRVISAYDSSKDITSNLSVMSSSRFKAEELDKCALSLGFPTQHEDSSKIYSNKASLAHRIILQIQSLYPTICGECKEEYSIPLAPSTTAPPSLQCFLCFQGSHDCDPFKSKLPEAEKKLPAGTVWLCGSCYTQNNPFKPKKGRARKESKTGSTPASGTSTPNQKAGNVHFDPSILSDRLHELNQKKETSGSQESPDNHTDTNPTDKKSINEDDICDKLKKGTCPHGVSGNTPHNGIEKCAKLHPKQCRRFMRNGASGKYGCKKGTQCPRYHPQHCSSSKRDRTCYSSVCRLVHLAGTRRREPPPRADSMHNGRRAPPPTGRKNSGYPNRHRSDSDSRNPRTYRQRSDSFKDNDTGRRNRFDSYSRSDPPSGPSAPSQQSAPSDTLPRSTAQGNQDDTFLALRDLLRTFQDGIQMELSQIKCSLTSHQEKLTELHHRPSTVCQPFIPPQHQTQPSPLPVPHPMNWQYLAPGC